MRIVLPLGYDTTWILPKLLSLGILPGDELFVLTITKDKRAKIALKSLDLMVDGLRARGFPLNLKIVEVDPSNFSDLLERCLEILSADYVTVLVGGGMRILGIALLQAALLSPREVKFEVMLESEGRWITVRTWNMIGCCAKGLSEPKIKILKTLINGSKSLDELVENLGRSKSTLSEHLDELESYGLVEKISARPAQIRLTPLGVAVARMELVPD
ncbi:MAG: CRISPR locus-related DNA-binding protein [Candidatus Korarchaeota archaeon]|nr:CRISPR locus-related DNA-binding protein [Candidatus Korarchaeota archaeon]